MEKKGRWIRIHTHVKYMGITLNALYCLNDRRLACFYDIPMDRFYYKESSDTVETNTKNETNIAQDKWNCTN